MVAEKSHRRGHIGVLDGHHIGRLRLTNPWSGYRAIALHAAGSAGNCFGEVDEILAAPTTVELLAGIYERAIPSLTVALEPPFVGRQSELQLIKDFYHATARDRGPRLVSVIVTSSAESRRVVTWRV